ncbi:MAG: hypothetical protein EA425_04755 [Puniceicoccaceae bacterium]|nr:MAG: hypothetical protein EA425_04755 [Puniceicoccaceae bacterium]
MSAKTAIVIFADPKTGSQEALGRVFNALLLARTLRNKGREFVVIFQGTGVRWASEVVKPDHPAHKFFKEVEEHVVGACAGCSAAFEATEAVQKSGLRLVNQMDVPGTAGFIDLSKYLDDGYQLVTF